MIEFTILLDNSKLEFEPASNNPELAFVLPPTARIGRDDDIVHLAPVPVHCFFNAITFGHWLTVEHHLTENDAFVAYAVHDMFKGLLHLVPGKPRRWLHQFEFFDCIRDDLKSSGIFDDFAVGFKVSSRHGEGKRVGKKRITLMPWREAVAHETDTLAGTEEQKRSWEWDWPMMGLTIRLQSALSNALSIAYVKQLFVESYVEAVRAEYPDVFSRFDAVSYEYEFVDPTTLTGNTDKDVETLCRQSRVYIDGKRLIIHSFIGAHGVHWQPGQETKVRLPFWLLLTLREDLVSILFPVPTLYGVDGKPANNPAFVDRVCDDFHQRVRSLLMSAQVDAKRQAKWSARVNEIMADIDSTFHIIHTQDFDQTTGAPRTETCSMCGSLIPQSFTCSPITDLGFSKSNYTDWHLGDADHACALCAISHFKTPDVLEPARKLIFHRKVVYFTTSTPSAKDKKVVRANTPFITAPGFKPQLDIRSLESLVTLNVIAALYLNNALRQAVHLHNGERDLWLEAVFPTGPFSFAGEIAAARSKAGLPAFLGEIFTSLNRPISLLDPLLPMQIEVPLHALVCLWGVSKGRHFQLKYKPLIVSNETGTLPVIWEGYHFIDQQTLTAIETLRIFVETFKHPKVSHRMKLTALASSPGEFIEILIQQGGFNYGTILERLAKLSGGQDVKSYLKQLRELIVQTPLIIEIWG